MKKHTKKLLSLALIIAVTAALFLAACSENKGSTLTGSPKDIVRDVTSKFDFSDVEFLYKGDDMAEDVLYFSYGIDDPSVIEDFAICQRADGRAASLAILKFGENVNADELKNTLQTYYVEAMYSLFQLYIPEEYDIALGATYKIYDNAIVLAIYDTAGNTEIFNVIDKYAE